MPDHAASTAPILGYCTNVHGGATLAETKANLLRHAVAVRQLFCPGTELPLGLWLSSRAVHSLSEEESGPARLRDWLHSHGLRCFTLNGFPYGDFHQQVVKRSVYQPHWGEAGRLLYTTQLADILVQLLTDGEQEGSISTLPIGWRAQMLTESSGSALGRATANLLQLARHLADIEARTGKCIHVDLEPEPGCVLQTAQDVVEWFDKFSGSGSNAIDLRRYIRVCHDTCHAAVMFEEQADVLQAYRAADIRVGKVQLSSALVCSGAARVFRELRDFDEPKWLHQTCVLDGQGEVRFFEDLEQAFDEAPEGTWRTHFHVPIHLESIGLLGTTATHTARCVDLLAGFPDIRHIEVETYAWSALPLDHRPESLAHGIAQELRHAQRLLARATS